MIIQREHQIDFLLKRTWGGHDRIYGSLFSQMHHQASRLLGGELKTMVLRDKFRYQGDNYYKWVEQWL